jgi:hypothetical protein
MKFTELLREKEDTIVARWLDGAFATYPESSSAAFKREKDPFANPVGHALRVATQGVFKSLLDRPDTEKIQQCLHEAIRIRAIQQFSASQAVGFVFQLKEIVRAELPEVAANPQSAADLILFEAEIDRVALVAFDMFVRCREDLCEIRVNELKRQTSWVLEKIKKHST